jgi:hypothetical protein
MPDGAARPWPALMREDTAAAYLDVSASYFRATIAPEVPRVMLSARVLEGRRMSGHLLLPLVGANAGAGVEQEDERDRAGDHGSSPSIAIP